MTRDPRVRPLRSAASDDRLQIRPTTFYALRPQGVSGYTGLKARSRLSTRSAVSVDVYAVRRRRRILLRWCMSPQESSATTLDLGFPGGGLSSFSGPARNDSATDSATAGVTEKGLSTRIYDIAPPAYSLSPHAIGPRRRHILFPLTRLVRAAGIFAS